MGVLHTAIVAVLVVAAAAAVAAGLRLADLPGFVLGVAVLAGAEVVGLSVVLSLFHWLTSGAITAAVLVVAVASLAWWRRAGASHPALPHGALGRWCRDHLAVTVLLAVVGAALGFQLWMGLRVPPNEVDSVLYHLPRAVAWVHRHSALQFQPGSGYWAQRQVSDPVNGELFVAWTMALSHSDRLANAVQWCFALGLGCAVVALARLMGFTRSAALLAAGGFLLFPEVLLQSATTQVDLVLAFFVAATAVFAVRSQRHGSATEVVLAAVAFGLALGTKESALFAVPALALIVAAAWWRHRPPVRILVIGAGAGVAAVVVFGSFIYVQNLAHTGEMSGGQNGAVAADFIRAGLGRNLARVSSTLVDAPGLPGASTVDRLLKPVVVRVVGTFQGSYYGTPPPVNTKVDDGESSYGLLGLLVLVPLGAIALARGPAPQRLLALGGLSYLVLLAARLGYSPEAPRHLLPAAALVSPLFAGLESHPWRRRAMVAVALAGVVPVLTLNTSKPLLLRGVRSILRADRIEAQLIADDDQRHVVAAEAVNRLVPTKGKLAVLNDDDIPSYVLYDAGLHREVVPVDRSDLDPVELRHRGFIGAFIWPAPPPGHCSPADCPVAPLPSGAVPLPGGAAFVFAAERP